MEDLSAIMALKADIKDEFASLRDSIQEINQILRNDYVPRREFEIVRSDLRDAKSHISEMQKSEAQRYRQTVQWSIGVLMGTCAIVVSGAGVVVALVG